VSLICSVRDCRAVLEREARRYVCANGHSFDLARSGYLNLLQPQDKRSKSPGDSEGAVAARRRFLDSRVTDPLVASVVAALPLAHDASLLDVGCGEGHHLAAFRTAYGIDGCGIDLSIPAIDLAAKRHRDLFWVVANADRFLPWADHSFDALMSITARLNPQEFHRVLHPEGTLLLALPGPDDLIELREAVLGEPQERDRVARTLETFEPLFVLERQEHIAMTALLGSDALVDVMTSSYRGLRPRERARLEELEGMNVTMARDLLVLRPA
jgi:23S rRNA (guanine745-N1)-methyltransferase